MPQGAFRYQRHERKGLCGGFKVWRLMAIRSLKGEGRREKHVWNKREWVGFYCSIREVDKFVYLFFSEHGIFVDTLKFTYKYLNHIASFKKIRILKSAFSFPDIWYSQTNNVGTNLITQSIISASSFFLSFLHKKIEKAVVPNLEHSVHLCMKGFKVLVLTSFVLRGISFFPQKHQAISLKPKG